MKLPRNLPDNQQVAHCLQEAAQHLEEQGANPFRVGAYLAAADTVANLDADIRALFDEGALMRLMRCPALARESRGRSQKCLLPIAGANWSDFAVERTMRGYFRWCRGLATNSPPASVTPCISIPLKRWSLRLATAVSSGSKALARVAWQAFALRWMKS